MIYEVLVMNKEVLLAFFEIVVNKTYHRNRFISLKKLPLFNARTICVVSA